MESPEVVVINTPKGRVATLPLSSEIVMAVLEWAHVARNRATWSADPFAYSELARKIREQFEQLELGEIRLREIAESPMVEISTTPGDCPLGFATAGAPWEYLLASATWELRNGRPFTVVRHIQTPAAPRGVAPVKVLIVISGPGAISEYYSFESEARLIHASFTGADVRLLRNPTLEWLRKEVKRIEPDVIHVTGVDIHQGATLLEQPASWSLADEGVFIADDAGYPTPVMAQEFAGALTAAKQKPLMVGLNFYNAATIAAHLVGNGAGSALAFHGTFDDRLAETFFCRFYEALQSEQTSQKAFEKVWRTIRGESRDVIGSGVVLWSADSIAPPRPGVSLLKPLKVRRRRAAPAATAPAAPPAPVPQGAPAPAPAPPASATPQPGVAKAEQLQPSTKPYELTVNARTTVNYSLLHNRRGLFSKFEIRKHMSEPLELQVDVTLMVGNDSYPFARTFRIEKPVDDLGREIYIPLTWISNLRLRESVLTNVTAKVVMLKEGEEPAEELLNRPYQVLLLPPDEWTDDDVNRQWLPSFVLPRDPAVSSVISEAEKLLPALADHRDAGFDGYQSIGRDAEDPYGAVDTQVQSIWAALSLHMQLRYVNPPPTYTIASQRVRTPSQVIGGTRGTCIDLALLIASCLEFVDIYPVLFLLQGHAFVGYWRSDALYREFLKQTPNTDTSADKSVWMYPTTAYQDVMMQIRSGALVPLEATLLTQRGGFGDAIEEGFMNLRNAEEFEALLDISLARQEGVRPLPLSEFA